MQPNQTFMHLSNIFFSLIMYNLNPNNKLDVENNISILIAHDMYNLLINDFNTIFY